MRGIKPPLFIVRRSAGVPIVHCKYGNREAARPLISRSSFRLLLLPLPHRVRPAAAFLRFESRRPLQTDRRHAEFERVAVELVDAELHLALVAAFGQRVVDGLGVLGWVDA